MSVEDAELKIDEPVEDEEEEEEIDQQTDDEENEEANDDDVDDEEDVDEDSIVDDEKNVETQPKIKTNETGILDSVDDLEESDDDDYEYDENMFKKLYDSQDKYDHEIYHPENKTINKEELTILLKIVKNKDGIIVDDLHKTVPFLTKYEFTKILGQRIKQLNAGNKPYIQTNASQSNYNIAEDEIREKKLPFIIKRPIPNGGCEYWRLEDLQILI